MEAALVPPIPQWLHLALDEIGQCEIPGAVNNPRIELYHSCTAGGASPDEVPWCASFVCWCLEQTGRTSPRSKRAAEWLEWGVSTSPRAGTVVVFPRTGGHHVGFVLDASIGMVYVLGGNQDNRVGVRGYSRFAALAYRWPVEV